jgi:hypothetical protein
MKISVRGEMGTAGTGQGSEAEMGGRERSKKRGWAEGTEVRQVRRGQRKGHTEPGPQMDTWPGKKIEIQKLKSSFY